MLLSVCPEGETEKALDQVHVWSALTLPCQIYSGSESLCYRSWRDFMSVISLTAQNVGAAPGQKSVVSSLCIIKVSEPKQNDAVYKVITTFSYFASHCETSWSVVTV